MDRLHGATVSRRPGGADSMEGHPMPKQLALRFCAPDQEGPLEGFHVVVPLSCGAPGLTPDGHCGAMLYAGFKLGGASGPAPRCLRLSAAALALPGACRA